MSAWVSDAVVAQAAEEALTAYEVSADWRAASRAAREYLQEETDAAGLKLSSLVGLAVNLAHLRWDAIVLATKQVIEEGGHL